MSAEKRSIEHVFCAMRTTQDDEDPNLTDVVAVYLTNEECQKHVEKCREGWVKCTEEVEVLTSEGEDPYEAWEKVPAPPYDPDIAKYPYEDITYWVVQRPLYVNVPILLPTPETA